MLILLGVGGVLGLGAAAVGLSHYISKTGQRVWKEKKKKLTTFEEMSFRWFRFMEEIAAGPLTDLKDDPVKYLIQVYDYLAIKNPDLEGANDYLRRAAKYIYDTEDPVFYIGDYWNSSSGRFITIILGKDAELLEKEILLPMEYLTDKVNKLEPEKPQRGLRVVK